MRFSIGMRVRSLADDSPGNGIIVNLCGGPLGVIVGMDGGGLLAFADDELELEESEFQRFVREVLDAEV